MSEAFDQMPHERKVEGILEGHSHRVIQLLEVLPLQGFSRGHHDVVQALILEDTVVVQGVQVLLQERQTRRVERYFVQLQNADGDPKERLVNGRLCSKNRFKPAKTKFSSRTNF